MPLDATSLHFQHPRGPPEAAAPPTSRSGPKIAKRPTDTLSTGGTGAAPGAAPERPRATEIPRMALFRPVAAVLALYSTYRCHLSRIPSSVFLRRVPTGGHSARASARGFIVESQTEQVGLGGVLGS